MQQLHAGDVVRLDRAASPQFATHTIMFRVIRQHDAATADGDGWAWLDGYQLDDDGEAVERRSVFVQVDRCRRQRPAVTTGR